MGDKTGVQGSVVVVGDSVGWMLTQPVAGTINWQIVANGTQQSGTF